jgi:hypothetical protein
MRTNALTGLFSSLMLVSALLVSGCASSGMMKSQDDSMKTMDKPMMKDSGKPMKDDKDMPMDMNNTM